MISLFSISIIVSTYSKSRLSNLCDCIESIKQQTIPVEEIILVLDHNKDLLTFFRSKFKDSVKVISSGGLGLCKARNVGVQSAKGDIVVFIDDDAVLINHASIFKELKDKIDDDENKHIIMPVVYIRGYPFDPMFFKWETNPEFNRGKRLTNYYEFKEQPVD